MIILCECAYIRAHVRMCPSRLGMSRCHACELRNSECHVCVRMALSWPSERVARSGYPEALCLGDLGRAKGLEVNGAGPSVEEEESMVFSNIEVRVKRAGPSGLGDLEVTEYIARIRSGPFEREDCAPVHLATTEARFMAD